MKKLEQQKPIYYLTQLVRFVYWETLKNNKIQVSLHGRIQEVDFNKLHN